MRTRLFLFALMSPTLALFATGLGRAQSTSDAFNQYANPHAICDYYRSGQSDIQTANGTAHFVIERESDSECLVSLGSGEFKSFTQYYYSGSDWCYKIFSGTEVVTSQCIAITTNGIDSSEYGPYIVGGVIIFAFILTIGSITANKPHVAVQPTEVSTPPPTYRPPQSVRSKVRKPKKNKRIWQEQNNWPKPRAKK